MLLGNYSQQYYSLRCSQLVFFSCLTCVQDIVRKSRWLSIGISICSFRRPIHDMQLCFNCRCDGHELEPTWTGKHLRMSDNAGLEANTVLD